MKAKKTRLETSQIGTSDEEQLAGFIDKFDSGNASLIRSVRKTLREADATTNELVYDNYNFFVIGYCGAAKPSSRHRFLPSSARVAGPEVAPNCCPESSLSRHRGEHPGAARLRGGNA